MQMLTKNEFKKELLNKYEVSHGLSNDIIDGMISRGFIPSVTNEIGDKTYNIDYYIENEDIFNNRLTEYKNTTCPLYFPVTLPTPFGVIW